MCLILTALSACISTLAWYASETARKLKISVLVWLFWGALIMWSVDLAFAYAGQGSKVFHPSLADAANDALLGLAVITFAMVIWIVVLLVSDPMHVIGKSLTGPPPDKK